MYLQTSAHGCHERKRGAVKNTAYRIFDPVPFTRVTREDTFWAPRLRVNREKTIPHIFTMLKKTGCVDAYTLQWKPGREKAPHQFWDSDVAKWIEAASYILIQRLMAFSMR